MSLAKRSQDVVEPNQSLAVIAAINRKPKMSQFAVLSRLEPPVIVLAWHACISCAATPSSQGMSLLMQNNAGYPKRCPQSRHSNQLR
jgi:hypothetical protein